MISQEFTKIDDSVIINALTEDQIQTVLYFSSHDGRNVIEVGGYNRYQLVEGVTLERLEKVLSGESKVKNLKSCLTKVPLSKITNNKPSNKKRNINFDIILPYSSNLDGKISEINSENKPIL